MNLYLRLWARAKQEYMIEATDQTMQPSKLTVHMDDDTVTCDIWVES